MRIRPAIALPRRLVLWVVIFTIGFFQTSALPQNTLPIDSLTMVFDFNEPAFVPVSGGRSEGGQRWVVPQSRKTIWVQADDASLDIQADPSGILNREMNAPCRVVEDVPIDGGNGILRDEGLRSSECRIWTCETFGQRAGATVFRIVVSPYPPDQTGTALRWIDRLTLRIRGRGLQRLPKDWTGGLQAESDRPSKIGRRLQDSGFMASAESRSRVRIAIREEGWIRIPQPMIAGTEWEGLEVDPQLYRVVGNQGEIPIRVSGESDGSFDFGDVVEFWGEKLWDRSKSDEIRLDVFSDENIYWLEWDENPGLRFGQEEGGYSTQEISAVMFPRSYLFVQHEEQDTYFYPLPYTEIVDDADRWFNGAPVRGGQKKEYEFTLVTPDLVSTQLVRLRLKLRGQSQSLAIHPVDVYINDQKVASGQFQGDDALILESPGFSPTYLANGPNRLMVVNRSDEGDLVLLFVDWFEVVYPRLYEAQNDILRFRPPPYSTGKNCRFRLEGFTTSSVEVYKIGVSRIYGCLKETVTDTLGKTTVRVTFEDQILDEAVEYIAFGSRAVSLPDSVARVEPTDLKTDLSGADEVILVPADSLGEKELSDLVALREGQGLRVKVVRLEDITNEFHFGIPHPEAIRSFLRYAVQSWAVPPRFVLLVGDAVIDARLPASQGNLIPVPFVQTERFGATPADHWYTILNGEDPAPALAIGRLPVRNRAELRQVIEKIVNYETRASGPWRNRYLLIGAGGIGGVFWNQTESLIRNVLSSRYRSERLYLEGSQDDPFVGGTNDLLQYLEEGVALLNFRGHGGGAIWSDNGLLDLDDLELIENQNRLPVVTSMTCFTADFASSRSLGESMILQRGTGAIAFWGSTGLGWLLNDFYLLETLYKVINDQPDLPIGEAIRMAKIEYLASYPGSIPLSEIYQFTLLGDPALRLTLPSDAAAFSAAPRALAPGDSVRVTGTPGFENGSYRISIGSIEGSEVVSTTGAFTGSSWVSSLAVPDTFSKQSGLVRAYVWGTGIQNHESGSVSFGIGRVFLDSLAIIPADPGSEDSLHFSIHVENPANITNISARILAPVTERLEMAVSEGSGRFATIRSIGPFPPGTDGSILVEAVDDSGSPVLSDTLFFQIPTLPDLWVQMAEWGGMDRVILNAWIRNGGEAEAIDVPIRFECPELGTVRESHVSMEGQSFVSVGVGWSPVPGTHRWIITLDPDSLTVDSRRDNNRTEIVIESDRFTVSPDSGTVSGTTFPDTVGLVGRVLCLIPPGSTTGPAVLRMDRTSGRKIDNPDMALSQSDEVFHMFLEGHSESDSLRQDAVLWFVPSADDSAGVKKPYQWDRRLLRWTICPFVEELGRKKVQTRILGYFRWMDSDDSEGPLFEIQIDEQSFAQGSYISRHPRITVVVEDSSGVDIRSGRIGVYVDDRIQDPEQLVIPDSTREPTHVSLSVRPVLEPGEHSVRVQAYDVHGNGSVSETVAFRVESRLEVQYLGNHPNPFQDETVFVYVLTDVAENVSLSLYTVSGRLIRRFEDVDLASPDYHEVLWDGKDDWGENVANGVYFFRLKVRGSGQDQEITGKVARIQ